MLPSGYNQVKKEALHPLDYKRHFKVLQKQAEIRRKMSKLASLQNIKPTITFLILLIVSKRKATFRSTYYRTKTI